MPPLSQETSPVVHHMFYHSIAFEYLHSCFQAEIAASLIDRPIAFRASQLRHGVVVPEQMEGAAAWNALFDYLGRLEQEMQRVLSRRVVFHWLHIYRRIGVALSWKHEGLTDGTTLGLVRDIAELAINKFGAVDSSYKPDMSSDVSENDILGGYFVKSLLAKFSSEEAATIIRSLKGGRQWVLTDFTKEDLFDIYYIEGLAYQYWRATAALRGVGKGAAIIFHRGDWGYKKNLALEHLTEHYDRRNLRSPFDSTLHGNWFRPGKADDPKESIISLGYNVFEAPSTEILGPFDPDRSVPLYTPNFYMAPINLPHLEESSKFLSAEFAKVRGYSIFSLLMVLRAVHMFALLPSGPDLKPDAGTEYTPQSIRLTIINLLQRGYVVKPVDRSEIVLSAMNYAKKLERGGEADEEDLERALGALILSPAMQARIGLWSRGPRFPLIEFDGGILINFEGVAELLNRMFVSVRDRSDAKGPAFEEHFRDSLRRLGYQIEHSGTITSTSSQRREIDACVRIGDALVLFECRAMEKPLDFEISKPSTMAVRQADLDGKVDQVLSLRDFILQNPRGRNYDFSWARRVHAFVVSPFVEYIWNLSNRLWEDKTPRIISATEAVEVLKALSETAST